MKDNTPVTRSLDAQNIPYRFFRHPGKVRSLEQAAVERGQRPEQIVRSIVFRLAKEDFLMVLIAGPEQVSWSKLRAHLGVSRITMASEDEVLAATGYPLGAVSPFGTPAPMRVLVDQRVLDEGELSIGSGVRDTTVILSKDDLLRALGDVELGDFCKC